METKYAIDNYYENLSNNSSVEDAQNLALQTQAIEEQNTKIAENSAIMSGSKSDLEHLANKTYDAFTMGLLEPTTTDFDPMGRTKTSGVADVLASVAQIPVGGWLAKGGMAFSRAINPLISKYTSQSILSGHILPSLSEAGKKYKSKVSYMFEHPVKSTLGFVGSNALLTAGQQVSQMTPEGIDTHRIGFWDNKHGKVNDEFMSSFMLNLMVTAPLTGSFLIADKTMRSKQYEAIMKNIQDVKYAVGLTNEKDMKAVQDAFINDTKSIHEEEPTVGSKEGLTDAERMALEAEKEAVQIEESINKELGLDETERRDGFTGLKAGEHEKSYDFYNEKTGEIHRNVKLLGAYKKYSKNGISRDEYIIANKLQKDIISFSDFEKISDGIKLASEKDKAILKNMLDEFSKLKSDFENKKINKSEYAKKVKESVINIKDTIYEIENNTFGSDYKKVRTRLKVKEPKTGAEHEWIRTNNEALELFKNNKKQKIKDLLEKTLTKEDIKKLVKEDNILKDFIDGLSLSDRKKILKSLKDKNKRKEILSHIEEYIDDIYRPINGAKLGSTVNPALFDLKIGGERILKPEYDSRVENLLDSNDLYNEGMDKHLKAYALVASKVFNDKDLKGKSKEEIRKIITEEINKPDEETFNYYASEVIDITNGLTSGTSISKNADTDFDLTDEEKKRVDELIKFADKSLDLVGINKDERITFKEDSSIEKRNKLSFFNAIAELGNYLFNGIEPTSGFARKIVNVQNNLLERMNIVRKLSGLKELEPKDIKENFNNFVVQLEDRFSKLPKDKTDAIVILNHFFKKDKNGNVKIKKEAQVLLYQAYVKTLSESLTKSSVRVIHDPKTGNVSFKIQFNTENFDPSSLGSKIVKKMIIDSGINKKEHPLLIDNVRNEIKSMFERTETGLERHLNQLNEGITIDITKNIKAEPEIINRIKGNFGRTKNENKIPVLDINQFTQTLHDFKTQKKEILFNGKNVFDNEDGLLALLNKLSAVNDKYELVYRNDHIGSKKDLDPNTPNPIKNELVEHLENQKAGSLDEAIQQRILISKSKAVLNPSEKSLILAMARTSIESFKNDELHQQSIEITRKHFDNITSYLNKEKPTKDDAINAIKSLKFLKLDEDGFDIASKEGYNQLIRYIEDLKSDENLKHYINEKSKELFFNEQSLSEHFNLALELKEQFDSYYNYIMNQNLEGLYAKINNTFSGRIMYDGDLQYHTNKFAKLFLRFDNSESLRKIAEKNKYKVGLFKDNKEAETYIISSIKTMIDEIDGLDLVSKDLQDKFKIAGDKSKIEKSSNTNIKDYLQVVKEVIEKKSNVNGELAIDSYKEATYLPKLKYIYEHFNLGSEKPTIDYKTFDPTRVIAEFDGNQNMIGVMNSILGIADDATGINGKIFNAKEDIYMEFLKATENAVANSGSIFLKNLMEEVKFSRSDIKRPSQAYNYGQSIRNTLNDFLHDMIVKDYVRTKTEAKDNVKSALVSRLHTKYATKDNIVELFGNQYNINALDAHITKEVNEYIQKLTKFKNIKLTKDYASFDNDTIAIFLKYYEEIVKKDQKINNPELANTYNTIREKILELAKNQQINLTSVNDIDVILNNLNDDGIKKVKQILVESLDYGSTQKLLQTIQSDMYKVDNTEILLMKIKSSLQDKEQQLFSNYNTLLDLYVDKVFLESINKKAQIIESTIAQIKDSKSPKSTILNMQKEVMDLFDVKSIEQNLFNKYNKESFINELANTFLENTKIVSSFKNEIKNNPQFKKVEEFKDSIETLYTLNVIKNVNKLQSVAINKDTLINKTAEDLGLSDEEKQLVFNEVNKNQNPTYEDIMNAFQIAVSKNIFGSKNFIKLSGIKMIKTPFGRKILPFTIKGTGYKDGLSFQSISAINKGLTYFIQSTESNALSLGSHLALKNGEIHSLIHRFDAQYGLQGLRVAKHQNDIYNALYADTQFLDYMKKDITETLADLSQQLNETAGGGSLKEALKKVARQMIISDAGEIKNEAQLTNKVNELENLLKYGYLKNINEFDEVKVRTKEEHIINKVDRLLKDKKEALKDIKDSEKITNQQFSNGIIESSMTKKEALEKMSDLRKIDEGKSTLSVDEPTIEHYALHPDELQNIDISMMNEAYNGMSAFFGSEFIKYFKLDYNFLDFEHNAFGSKLLKDKLQIISTKGTSKVEVNNTTGQIKLYLKKGISNTEDVYKVVHELTHMLLHTKQNNELVKQVRTSLVQIARDLKAINKGFDFGIKIGDKVVTLDKYMQFNEAKKLPDNVTAKDIEEFESIFFHTLLGNDLIKSNKKLLAYLSKGKKDVNAKVSINGDIQGIQLYKDGKVVQNVTTIKQLNEILKKMNINNDLKGIKNTALTVYGLLNTEPKLKGHILREQVAEDSFGKMFNDIQQRVDYFDTVVSKANEKFFSQVGLYELLDISNDRLALNQALNLYNGAEKKLIKHAHKSREIYENKIKEIEPTEYEKLDQALGLATTFGLHILNSDIVKTPITNRLGSLLNEINTDFFTSIKVTNEGIAKSFYKKLEDHYQKRILNEIENKFGVDVSNRVDELAKQIAYGNDGSVKNLAKFIKENMYPDLTDKNARTLAKKLGSIKMLLSERGFKNGENAYTKQLNYVFEHMKEPTHREAINEIFFNFEQNSNKYTTFGENVDLQFLKDSKTLYLSEDPNLGDNHKVATIYDNGKKYYIYTKYVYDTRLGAQEHQLLSFNLDEFEKGVFKREYEVNGEKVFVSINPQNMKLKNELFNTHISVQAQKNAYANQKINIGRDILYRQFKLLRENGVLLTKKEVDERMKNFNESKEVYKKLSKDNPLSQVFGTEFWINKSVSHYLEGTTGIHLERALNNVMSEKTSRAVALTIKTMSDLTKQISSTILGVLPKFWFTSWLASYTVYAMHADNGFVNYAKYHKKAQKALKLAKKHMELKIEALDKKAKLEYQLHKEPNNEAIKKQLDEINKDIETYDTNLKNLGVLEAFEYGIGSTMRLDLLEVDSKKELNMFNLLKNTFGKDSNAYHFAKVMAFDPKHNRLGKIGYDIFESSELVPKLALYYNLLENKKLKPSESANYVSMAYPRYNNLNGVASIASDFIPYTKFMLEFPRMVAMMSLASPKKYLATALMMNYLTAFGYGASMQDGTDTWEERHNIFMVNDEFGINLNSMISNFEVPAPFVQSPFGVYDWGLSVFTDPANNILPLAYFK